jgi:phytoene dehydrogenase-like protein
MTATQRWDAIVIGAGVNGLVTAHYLSRAGRRVLVVEQRDDARAELETGWVPPQVVRELGLGAHGFRVEQPDPWIAAPLPAGGRLELWRDVAKSADAIRRVSPADAARWPEFCLRMRRLAGVLEALYVQPAPDVETRELGELLRLGRLGLHVRRLGKQAIIDLARILPMSVAELLDDWFENDALKGTLGAAGVWHLKQGPCSGGTAFNFLHHHVGSPAGVFRPPRSNITKVLEGMKGVEVRRGNRAAVLENNSMATGVVLATIGETILAPVVASSADPRAALRDLRGSLDPEFTHAVSNIKCRGVVARGTVQLDRAADFSTLCIAPSLQYLERAYDDAKYGRDSAHPYVEALVEDGRIDVHVQYVPFSDQKRTDEQSRALAASVAAALNVQPGRLTLRTPEDWERLYDLTEGHLYHGELTLDQILFMRPVPGWSRHRTPIEGLYLCGAGTHPGGGIAGAAGRNAARVVLKGERDR